MKTNTQIEMVKALNLLITLYNKNTPGVNYIDVRNMELALISEGINIQEINAIINSKTW